MRNILKGTSSRKVTGPDVISNKMFNMCRDQLAGVFARLFQLSLNTHSIPMLWKTSCVTPVPKISKPVVNNDYRGTYLKTSCE